MGSEASSSAAGGSGKPEGPESVEEMEDPSTLSESDWKKKLTSEEFRVLRKKGTERAYTGEYDSSAYDKLKEGYFACRGCGHALYSYKAKYKNGCGWPAFDMCYKGSIKIERDRSHGMDRVEIMCAKCDGHLGHVFGHGKGRTDQRHCVNSISVRYVKGKEPEGTAEEATLDLGTTRARGY